MCTAAIRLFRKISIYSNGLSNEFFVIPYPCMWVSITMRTVLTKTSPVTSKSKIFMKNTKTTARLHKHI